METIIIAILTVAAIGALIALLIANKKLQGYKKAGIFFPGKDRLKIIYYYLSPEDKRLGKPLSTAETRTAFYIIESKHKLVSADKMYHPGEVKERIEAYNTTETNEVAKTANATGAADELGDPISGPKMPPPPVGKVLIAIDVTLVHDDSSEN